ncbi:MAG TPA: hypothetical protein VG759_00615 [Candidatus Angelobacter sp.]|nr:hypothetical protein [Candidatus Angelobacter sp.]
MLFASQTQPEDTSQFVQEILSRAGSPSAVTLNFDNVSSLPAADLDALKKSITAAFRASGIRLVKAEFAVAEIQITFSEDWQNFVWVAAIRQGTTSQVVIRKIAKPSAASTSRAPTLTVHKNVVWQQEAPILDFFIDGPNLYVLEPEQIVVYGNENGKWRPKQSLAVVHEQTWPRDLRGRLQIINSGGSGSQITAYLPGTLCSGAVSPPALQCHPSDDPWQIDMGLLTVFFSPTRNFFTGVLAGQKSGESVPPFFSGAVSINGDSRQWVFAGIDGRARFYRNTLSTPAATITDWGSSVATIQSTCSTGRQVLVSSANDLTRPDTIQAFEMSNREATPVSATVELSGPIKALWPSEGGQSVHGAVESLASGKYDAVVFTVTCP